MTLKALAESIVGRGGRRQKTGTLRRSVGASVNLLALAPRGIRGGYFKDFTFRDECNDYYVKFYTNEIYNLKLFYN